MYMEIVAYKYLLCVPEGSDIACMATCITLFFCSVDKRAQIPIAMLRAGPGGADIAFMVTRYIQWLLVQRRENWSARKLQHTGMLQYFVMEVI